MFCPNCGAKNSDNVSFCDQCGKPVSAAPAPVDKAAAKEAVKEMVKDSVGSVFSLRTVDQVQTSWKNFSFDEKVIAAGGMALVAGFFFPWVESSYVSYTINGVYLAKEGSNWIYVMLLVGILPLFLVFSSHKKTVLQKILNMRWQMIIGMIFAVGGLCAALAMQGAIDAASIFGSAGKIGIGWQMMSWGGVAIVFGAVRLQKRLLKTLNIN